MKLVFKTDDYNVAQKYCQLLEEKGIPSELYEHGIKKIGSYIPNGNEVWIYVNSQYDDALKLIDDPSHEVKECIDVEEFEGIYNSQQKEALQLMYKKLAKYGFILIGLSVLLVIFLVN